MPRARVIVFDDHDDIALSFDRGLGFEVGDRVVGRFTETGNLQLYGGDLVDENGASLTGGGGGIPTRLDQLTGDTLLSAVAEGDLLYRGAAKWNNLAKPNADGFLQASGSGLAWTQEPILANGLGLQGRDSGGTPQYLLLAGDDDICYVGFEGATPTNGHLALYAGGSEAARFLPDGRFSVGTTTVLTDTKMIVQGTRADANGTIFWGLDSSGRSSCHITTHGRIDLQTYDTDGGIMVLDYLPATPAVNTRAGHYAFGNKDSAGNRQTIGLIECWLRDTTAGSVDSELSLEYMVAQDCSAGANQQPATKVVFSAAGSVLPSLPLVLGGTPATAGDIRLPTASSIQWRNNANSANINAIGTNSSDQLLLSAPGGITLSPTITDPATAVVTMSPVYTLTTTGKALLAAFPIVVPSGGTIAQIYGLNFVPVLFGTEGVTTNPVTRIDGVMSRLDTNAAYDSAIGSAMNFTAAGTSHAGGGTITSLYGFYSSVNPTTRVTNAWQFYAAGTAPSFFGGNVQVVGGLQIFTKAGAVADGDFTSPANGMIAIDTTNSKLYARIGGSWKSVTLA